MTQKELQYVEDAIAHEASIIKICQEETDELSEANFKSFMEGEIRQHTHIMNDLITLLKEESNE